MAQFDYSRMQGTASRLMTRFKQGTVTLSRLADTGVKIDVDAPWLGNVMTTTVYALAATANSVEDKFVDGTTILATDTMLTAGPFMTKTHVDGLAVTNEVVATEFAPGDVVSIDGQAVTVIKEMRVPKAGTLIAYKLITRG